MKALVALVFGGLSSTAMANEVAQDFKQPPVERYNYSQHLDIARVISVSEVPDVRELVPARMIYEDSKGQRHTLEYTAMGKGLTDD